MNYNKATPALRQDERFTGEGNNNDNNKNNDNNNKSNNGFQQQSRSSTATGDPLEFPSSTPKVSAESLASWFVSGAFLIVQEQPEQLGPVRLFLQVEDSQPMLEAEQDFGLP